MKWLKSWLLQQPNGAFNFEESLTFDVNLIKATKYLLGLKKVTIEGEGFYSKEMETLTLDLKVMGTMVVPCAISLEPVDYYFETESEVKYTFNNLRQDDEIIVVKGSEIDIIPFVWELISLEIPLKVVKTGAQIQKKGENWEMTSDDEPIVDEKIDPRFAKLKDYFKKQ